jgi:hypothetical protein
MIEHGGLKSRTLLSSILMGLDRIVDKGLEDKV